MRNSSDSVPGRGWSFMEVLLFISFLLTLFRGLAYRQTAIEFQAEGDSVAQSNSDLTTDFKAMSGFLSGTYLPTTVVASGVTQFGTQMHIRFSEIDHPLMVMVVNPDCPGCIQEIPEIRSMLEQKSCDEELVLGFGVGPTSEVLSFVSKLDLRFPVLNEGSGTVWQTIPLHLSPLTLLLGPHGQINSFFTGRMSEAERGELANWLEDVCLPGTFGSD